MSSSNAIGLFDSGIGGLTVLQEVSQLLPHENLIYLGDTARFPYGNKSPDTILHFAKENARFLQSKNIKLLVIPCYTACTVAHKFLQEILPIPVVGIVEAGTQQLIASTQTNCVAILGTTRTIESGFLQSQILAHNPRLQIHAIACPLFASFVEEGLQNHATLYKIAHHYLAPLKHTNVDCILLACTHYPFLEPILKTIVPSNVQLLSPAKFCAEQILDTLTNTHLLNRSTEKPEHHVYVSANPKKFHRQANRFLTSPITKIELAQNMTL
jgi:glutamate racemase